MLLFFDIDGTLFDDRGELPASVLPALEQAHAGGHLLLINTGRTLCNKDHRLDGFPLDGWIMGCGTRVTLHGETLQSLEYSLRQSLRLREVFLRLQLPVVYECDTGMYFDPMSASHPAVTGFQRFARKHGLARQVTETDPEFRAVKMFCFTEDAALIRLLESETAALGLPFTAIDRDHGGWEVVPAGFSKATGIDVVRRKVSAGLEECYAFGDSRNDLPMLLHVGHSVAMGNASDEVKACCSFVTDRPEEDGIRNALRSLGLI